MVEECQNVVRFGNSEVSNRYKNNKLVCLFLSHPERGKENIMLEKKVAVLYFSIVISLLLPIYSSEGEEVKDSLTEGRERQVIQRQTSRLSQRWNSAKQAGDKIIFERTFGRPKASYRHYLNDLDENPDLLFYFYEELPNSMRNWKKYLAEPLKGMVVFSTESEQRAIKNAISERNQVVSKLLGARNVREIIIPLSTINPRYNGVVSGTYLVDERGDLLVRIEKTSDNNMDIFLIDEKGNPRTKTDKEFLQKREPKTRTLERYNDKPNPNITRVTGKRIIEHTQHVSHPATLRINTAYQNCQRRIENIKSGKYSFGQVAICCEEPVWHDTEIIKSEPLGLKFKEKYESFIEWRKIEKEMSPSEIENILGKPTRKFSTDSSIVFLYYNPNDIPNDKNNIFPQYSGALMFKRNNNLRMLLNNWVEPDWCFVHKEDFGLLDGKTEILIGEIEDLDNINFSGIFDINNVQQKNTEKDLVDINEISDPNQMDNITPSTNLPGYS